MEQGAGILLRMVGTQAMLFIYMAVGVVVRKTNIITDKTRGSYNLFLIYIALPALILSGFLQGITAEQLADGGLIIAVSLCVALVSWGAGALLFGRRPSAAHGALMFGSMFSNAGNAGIPVINMVFGSVGVFYASCFMIPTRVLMWSIGVSFFLGGKKSGKLRDVLLNPALIVVAVGFAIMLTGIKVPGILTDAIENIGGMAGPLAMILIGTTLAETDLRTIFVKDAFLLAALRLLAIPLATLAALRLLRVDSLLTGVAVTLLSMPVATNTAVIAERYGGDYHFASRCVVLATLLSLITVPFISSLL
jgi:malate permease and related proteins